MKLICDSKNLKTYRIVSRANHLVVSPFFKSEVNRLISSKKKDANIIEFEQLLESECEIPVKTHINLFSKSSMTSKMNIIYVNKLKLKSSHRDLLAELLTRSLEIMDIEGKVSKLLHLQDADERSAFFNEFGAISKSYI